MDGYLDVYWLYDDGGLTLLMAYIMTTRCQGYKNSVLVQNNLNY
jgi:Solute carrier family 12